MALQSSGAISLNEIHIEAGGSSGSECAINDSDIRGLISKSSGATMAFNEWYGASNVSYIIDVSPNISGSATYDLTTALNLGTHGQWTISPQSNDITVDIKMWGGGGASGWLYYTTNLSMNVGKGGGGGAAVGRLVLKQGVDYVLRVGEGGQRLTTGSSPNGVGANYEAGGSFTAFGPEGGGYSGIFKTTSISQSTAKLMAGGGGAGGDDSYDGYGAGSGGGTSGQSGNGGAQSGGGGSQTAGGSASPYNNASAGSALFGGAGQTSVTYAISSPGGGGYYGGGGGNVGGGGGGSGYFDSSDSDLTNETLYTGNRAIPGNNSDSDRGGSGDGGNSSDGDDGRIILTVVT